METKTGNVHPPSSNSQTWPKVTARAWRSGNEKGFTHEGDPEVKRKKVLDLCDPQSRLCLENPKHAPQQILQGL